MPRSEKSIKNITKYKNDYAREHYKRVALNVSFDLYDKIKSKADTLGLSVNAYIKHALEDDLSE